MANPFKNLSETIRSRSVSHIDASEMNSHLSEVLDEHLDSIAAAHNSGHNSWHHSLAQPGLS